MILLALQFWKGDYQAAMEVARLVADMEPTFNNDAQFLFMARRDFKEDVQPTVDYVSNKFKTYFAKGERCEIGYPGGSNALWQDTMHWVYTNWKPNRNKQGILKDIECVLTFEGDCFPTRYGWIEELLEEWRANQPCDVLGHYIMNSQQNHINGNALFSPNLTYKIPGIQGCSVDDPWDLHHWRAYQKYAKPSKLIWSLFKQPTISENRILEPFMEDKPDHPNYGESIFPCLIHGVKDNSGRTLIRKIYGIDALDSSPLVDTNS